MDAGDRVRIKGLKSETGKKLNGRIGFIIKKVKAKDGKMRFQVKVRGRDKTFALRKENLAIDSSDERGIKKHVICPMCKTQFVAESQQECEEHMKTCPVFSAAYGTSGSASLETQSNAVLHGIEEG